LIALLFLTRNAASTMRIRMKAGEFLERLDESAYNENVDMTWRIALARGVAQAVLRQGARALPAVETRLLEDTEWADLHGQFFEAHRNQTGHAVEGEILQNELSDEEILYIDSYVSTRLRYYFLWANAKALREIVDRIDSGDLGDIEDFNDEAMTAMERVVQQGRRSRAAEGAEGGDFRTGERSFEEAVRDASLERNRPQSLIRTGVGMLNEMLGGGFQGGRVYVNFGRSGSP
jgi:hypothetical protein